MHIVASEKGKPPERRGRKSTGLRAIAYDSGAAKVNDDNGKTTRIDGKKPLNSRYPLLSITQLFTGKPDVHLECN